MEARLVALRNREFAVVDRHLYLNHAGIGPLPRRAVAALAETARSIAEDGDVGWFGRLAVVERVRGRLARLLGARHDHEVAFVANTADGLSLVAAGLPWQEGDTVVGVAGEYPSAVYPWTMLADRGVVYRTVPEEADGRLDVNRIVASFDDRTRVLAISWVQYGSGFRADLAALGTECRRRGILFVVDVIQGLGALRFDAEALGVDVAAAATHKWLLGPEGLGVLYISDRVVDRIRKTRAGWRSVPHMLDMARLELRYHPGAHGFECGTLNILGIVALEGALEVLEEAGAEAVEQRVLALAGRLARGLAERDFQVVGGPEPQAGIVTATHPRHPAADLVQRLLERGVATAERRGRLRLSPHFYNTEEEIERCLEILAEVAELS